MKQVRAAVLGALIAIALTLAWPSAEGIRYVGLGGSGSGSGSGGSDAALLSGTVTSAANLDIDLSGLSAENVVVVLDDLTFSGSDTDGIYLNLMTSADGTTFDTGDTTYYTWWFTYTSPTGSNDKVDCATYSPTPANCNGSITTLGDEISFGGWFKQEPGGSGTGVSTAAVTTGRVEIRNRLSTTRRKPITWNIIGYYPTSYLYPQNFIGYGERRNEAVINGVRIHWTASRNITGSWAVYALPY